MFILKYTESDKQTNELEDRLREMTLAFKTERHPAIQGIILSDHNLELKGFTEINNYLDKLQGELHQWYYCNC